MSDDKKKKLVLSNNEIAADEVVLETEEISEEEYEELERITDKKSGKVEISAEMTPELYSIMRKAEEKMIESIENRIKALKQMKIKYDFTKEEIETLDLCIKNYEWNVDMHKKAMEQMKEDYKSNCS